MATSKTLTPTGVTISIPAFTDKPDQRVNSNCIDKIADAVNELADSITVCIPQISNVTFNGSTSTVGTTSLNISSYVPSGYGVWAAEVLVQEGQSYYQLPWFNDSLSQFTVVSNISNASIVIKNKASWPENTNVWVTLFCKKN